MTLTLAVIVTDNSENWLGGCPEKHSMIPSNNYRYRGAYLKMVFESNPGYCACCALAISLLSLLRIQVYTSAKHHMFCETPTTLYT